MINYNTFNKRLLTGFLAAIAVIGVVTIVAYNTIRSARKADDWVAHTYQVIDNSFSILSKITNARHEENVYLRSGNPQQLKNYYQSINTIKPDLYDLKASVADNPQQERNVDSLIKYTTLELQQMSELMPGQHESNDSVMESGELVRDIAIVHCREIGNNIIDIEKKLLLVRKQKGVQDANTAICIILSSAAVVIVILSFLLAFISKAFLARQKLREQLQLSENMFSGAFTYSGIGMALVSLNGNWIDINPFLLRLLGYNRGELLNKTFQDITHPDDLEADLVLLDGLLKGDLETYKLEKRYFHKQGHIVWIMLTVSLVHDKDGTPSFFVSQIEDITATKNLIHELELKNQMLSQTSAELENKVHQLEEFNRIVAHNLRGPAGGIEMMLDIMVEENDPIEKEEMLQLILGSAKSLNATLRDLMRVLEVRLSRDIEYDNCDIQEIVKTTTQMLQGEILNSKATIRVDLPVAHVRFPKIYLESIFYNLMSNSLKYKKDGIPVEINISSQLENDKTMLIFEDNGLGIDLDLYGQHMFKLNKVFHKGYNSKGVGLFITKNQLETHGGSILVESNPGVGSKFIVYL